MIVQYGMRKYVIWNFWQLYAHCSRWWCDPFSPWLVRTLLAHFFCDYLIFYFTLLPASYGKYDLKIIVWCRAMKNAVICRFCYMASMWADANQSKNFEWWIGVKTPSYQFPRTASTGKTGLWIMMTSSNGNISALLDLCAGNSPVTGEFPHKGQWRGTLMFSLICVWINA